MNTNKALPSTEKPVKERLELVRSSFSYMLNEHIRVYKFYYQLYEKERKDKGKLPYYPDGISLYDENDKIDWRIIRRFMPFDIETFFKKEYHELNKNEIRLCCLLYLNVESTTISKILPYRQKSITVIKFNIRKKTGLKDLNDMFDRISPYFISK